MNIKAVKYQQAQLLLRRFNKIVVSGPDRSGTTIAAEIIAYDLPGFSAIREEAFGQDGTELDYSRFRTIIAGENNFTLQSPGLCHFLHRLEDEQNLMVVFMHRKVEDIIKSQDRIGGWTELNDPKYKGYFERVIAKDKINFRVNWADPLAQVKYDFWHQVQKPRLKHTLDLDYESLAGHPLWLGKPLRQGFHHRQTTLEGSHIGKTKIIYRNNGNT